MGGSQSSAKGKGGLRDTLGACFTKGQVWPSKSRQRRASTGPTFKAEIAGLSTALGTGIGTGISTIGNVLNVSGKVEREPSHVSNCAVSLAWLTGQFLREHPEVEGKGVNPTTGEVMKSIVQVATARTRGRYTDLLLQGGKSSAAVVSQGQPFYFISHGWARPFSELLGMLRKHFSPEQQRVWRPGKPVLPWTKVFVWLDIFAINQHPGDNQRNDLQALREVVVDAEQTLMILDQEGAVLTRIWCLYEVLVRAWQTGRKGKGKLVMLAYGTKFEPLEKVFIDLDVAKAKATCDEDRIRILADIEKDVGVMAMGHDLKNALVDSVVAEVPPKAQRWDKATGYKLYKAARLCQLYGRLEQALPLYKWNLEGSERVLGAEHPDTLMGLNNLAKLLQALGKLDEAEPLYRRALYGSEKVLGSEHPSTLTAVNNMAALLQAQGKLNEAEPLYRQNLEAKERVLGPEHPSTLASVNNLATLYKDQGKLRQAEPLFRRALSGREKVLGPEHPHTLTSLHNLATLLKEAGKFEEAAPMFERAAAARERVLGARHPKTIKTNEHLAKNQQQQGKYLSAAATYIKTIGVKK